MIRPSIVPAQLRGCASSLRGPGAGLFLWLASCGSRLYSVTITEIQYDPPGRDAGTEFVELYNDSPTLADVSGWAFSEGILFTFPSGTWISGRGYVVVCENRSAFEVAYPGVAVLGQFEGRLDSSGETLVLSNNGGGEVLRVPYRERGKWTSVPTGTGHSLSLLRPTMDPSEPESWGPSLERGGTPGRPNFPPRGVDEVEIVGLGETWTYKKGTAEFSIPADAWTRQSFVPAGWLDGPTPIGYGYAGDATVLDDMALNYISVAARKTFEVSAEELGSMDALVLALRYDDGFVAYLNGTEVARAALPGEPGSPVPRDAAAEIHDVAGEEQFEMPAAVLTEGTNVLAIQGHNWDLGSSDFQIAPRVLKRARAGGDDGRALVFNEFLGRTGGSRWVEIYNPGPSPVDASGYFLSDSADALDRFALPAGSSLPAGGFLVVSESQCRLDFARDEVHLYLTRPDLSGVVAADIFENVPRDGRVASRQGFSDARLPDGGGPFGFARVPTPGGPNRIEVNADVIINEIMYHPIHGGPSGQYLELHNRGALPVDIGGWSFTKGISYTFPPGSSVPAGGFVVIALDPAAIEETYSLPAVFGPWEGRLSRSGESIRLLDLVGNTVDEVRYHDGGLWSAWADGGGSSLELIDPRQDNSVGTAWGASDESARSRWTSFTYTGPYVVEAESELHFLLLDAGSVLIDDISLQRPGSSTEYVPNGGFESGTQPWLIQGTHVASHRVTTDAHSGQACLELEASGGGDNGVNKIETDTTVTMSAGTYTVSFWARWLRGADKLLTRADSRTGASLSRVHQLDVPVALGTPGRENSLRAALRDTSPDGNLGPVLSEVAQSPVAPSGGQPVLVSTRAQDADGVASLILRYRAEGEGDGSYREEAMLDDGAHGDGDAGDGRYAAWIPAFVLGSRVAFYIEGIDTRGAARRYPVEAPAMTLLYTVRSPQPSPLLTLSLTLDEKNETELTRRLAQSDDLVDASLVLDDEEIFYNVGLRYHGSPWNRNGDPKMFRVRFNDDHPFIRRLKAINLSRWTESQKEGAAYYGIQGASRPGSPAPTGDYLYARVFHNGALHTPSPMGVVETVNNDYVDKWFSSDPDGYLFKIPGRRNLDEAGQRLSVEWTTLEYRGGAPELEGENYRWYFTPASRVLDDRWTELVALCSTLDPDRTPDAEFESEVVKILDVEQLLRVLAPRALQSDWDSIGLGNGQNAYLYYAPAERRWKMIPWDVDESFTYRDFKLFPTDSDEQISRLIRVPAFRRVYLRVLQGLLQGAWRPDSFQWYLDETASVTGLDASEVGSFVAARHAFALGAIPKGVAFALTHIGTVDLPSGWHGEHAAETNPEALRGTAPIDAASIVVLRNGLDLELPLRWTSVTEWEADLPLVLGENRVQLLALDESNGPTESYPFVVTSSTGWEAPVVLSVEPDQGPPEGGISVSILGTGFREGARAFFGQKEVAGTLVLSSSAIRAVSPPGSGIVSVRVRNLDGQVGDLAGAFEFTGPQLFIRGDVSLDSILDISDPVRTLLYLFEGLGLDCLDAADADDDGAVSVTDAVLVLDYLFLRGRAPAAPFPHPGTDPETLPVDGLDCSRGL